MAENCTSKLPIEKVGVILPPGNDGKFAVVLYNAFTKEECDRWIKKSEKKGYVKALVNVGFGRQEKMLDVRNNDRCIWDSKEEANKIFERIKEYIPDTWKGHKMLGLNERLRFLRYHPGEYFKPHHDGNYVRDNGEISFITVQVYLNEGFSGGETTFLSLNTSERSPVVPKTGSVLLFQHNIFHEGSELTKGVKYAIRTDVMYSKEAVASD